MPPEAFDGTSVQGANGTFDLAAVGSIEKTMDAVCSSSSSDAPFKGWRLSGTFISALHPQEQA